MGVSISIGLGKSEGEGITAEGGAPGNVTGTSAEEMGRAKVSRGARERRGGAVDGG